MEVFLGVWLTACGTAVHGPHRTYSQTLDTAMQLGVEQHELALKCAQERLNELKPGGFSLSPRYRPDPRTGQVQYLPPEQVKKLLETGRSGELRGSIEPDIVIHTGSPLHVQAAFDFKFPCMNGGQPLWRKYPEGHSYAGRYQGDVYFEILKVEPMRVIPRFGVVR